MTTHIGSLEGKMQTAEVQPQMSFVREGFVNLTPAQANQVLKWCRYARQRDESRAKAHIGALAEQMRRGLWLPKTQIDFARRAGRLILVNGHHRMRAQIDAGVDIVWSVVIHDCASDDDVAALYWKFDTTVRKRSTPNILDGIGFADRTGLKRETARALWESSSIIANGMRFFRYQQEKPNLLPDERQAMAESYTAEAQRLEAAISVAPGYIKRKLLSASRFSVMLVTMHHQRDQATAFWGGVAEDDGLAKGDPRKALLVDMQTRTNKGLQVSHMMAAARAWNAFFEGRTAQTLKVTGKAVPINGTPYTVQA